MRNRITWKGFYTWLMKQKDEKPMYCSNPAKCPIAQYVLDTLKINNVDVNGHDDVSYINRNGNYIRIEAPVVMSAFINKFDTNKNNKAKSAKEIAKEINKNIVKAVREYQDYA